MRSRANQRKCSNFANINKKLEQTNYCSILNEQEPQARIKNSN